MGYTRPARSASDAARPSNAPLVKFLESGVLAASVKALASDPAASASPVLASLSDAGFGDSTSTRLLKSCASPNFKCELPCLGRVPYRPWMASESSSVKSTKLSPLRLAAGDDSWYCWASDRCDSGG